MREWIWICPLCSAHGRKLLRHSDAQDYGRCHLHIFHKSSEYPLVTRMKHEDREGVRNE